MHFLLFCLGYFMFWIQASSSVTQTLLPSLCLKYGDITEVERVMEMLLFYNNSSHSCKVHTVICQPTNLLFSFQPVESNTLQQHIMTVFNPLYLRGWKKIHWLGYKICETMADGLLMQQIKAVWSSLLINPLHTGKSY